MRIERDPKDWNVLMLVKGEERYVWMYADDQAGKTLTSLGRAAANPELSFTWHDALRLSQRIREQLRK